jgi:hypothetical protein
MKGFKDTTRVQYFRGGRVGEGREVEKAQGGRVTDPVRNKTGGKNDPEYGDYEASRLMVTKRDAKGDWKEMKPSRLEVTKRDAKGDWKEMRPMTGAASTAAERRAVMKKAEGGKVDMKQDKKAVASGVHKHERNMHPGKPLTRMQRGGGVPVAKSGPMIKGSSKC